MQEEYAKDTQVSKRLGLAVQTLRNYRQQGVGPAYYKIGRAVRYRWSDVEAYMQHRRVTPAEDRG